VLIKKTGTCMYRSKNGLKCAAGHLIPDDKYSYDFEDHPCYLYNRDGYTEEFLSVVDKISEILIDECHDAKFVCMMQEIHDSSEDFDDWKKQMIAYAKHHDLSLIY
jgi:hypothetical protein